MRLWPRTLFGRNLLLMAGLILFAQLAMGLLFRQFVQEPRAARLIDFAQTHAHAIQAALALMTPEQRSAYLKQLDHDGLARVTQGGAPAPFMETPRPIVRGFLKRLGERLGPGYRLGWEDAPARRLWVGTSIGAQDYWLGYEANSFVGNITPLFLSLALGAGGLAFLGAYLVQRRINRPLRALARAADGVARGRIEAPRLEQDAPLEIAQVAASFTRMAADLEAAERERALMLAGVSHDLRTPLAKLRLATEILAPQGDAELIAMMVRNIATADAVIDQFIDFARLGSDESLSTCDLGELARDVAGTAAAPQLRLDLADLAPYTCRPVALRRAVANLVENALRYGAGEVVLRTALRDGRVAISVTDGGPGIPAAELERMRQPFTRLEAARSGKPGAGLGLAIVERIARLHGGQLQLRSRPEGGLDACLLLPAEPRGPGR